MDSAPVIGRRVAVLLSAAAACAPFSDTARRFATRDVGPISVRCERFTFIASLNDDDDDRNRSRDARQTPLPAAEDNLRQFDFDHPEAAEVYVSPIVTVADLVPAVGTRVRAWAASRGAPFDFTRRHPVPVTLYLEGLTPSGARGDLGFEYQYIRPDGTTLCGGGPTGTVTAVTAALSVPGSGAPFDRHRKMLVTGAGAVEATVTPTSPGTIGWTYDGDGSFAAPAALSTTFAAGQTFTAPPRDTRFLRFQLNEAGQVIEALHPVNLTAPRHVSTNIAGFDYLTGWNDANQGRMDLVPQTRIPYVILDQFREPIDQSAYAGKTPQIRENIGRVLTSPLPTVAAWIQAELSWARDWTSKPEGRFVDRIEILRAPKDVFVQTVAGRRSFHPPLQAVGGIAMHIPGGSTHQWELSVNGVGAVAVTQNTFTSVVDSTRSQGGGIQIRIRSRYGVTIP